MFLTVVTRALRARRRRRVLLVALAPVTGLAQLAWAQPAPAPDGLELPRLVQAAEPVYPEVALRAAREGDVPVVLTVEADGTVSHVEAVSPAAPDDAAGQALDAAAIEAGRRLRLTPARQDGVPVVVRVPYVFRFRTATAAPPPMELPAPADDPQTVVVHGASAADELRRSSAPVRVVDTRRARREAADLGEVLARAEGVGVRRNGGLGSDTRLSLQGLTDDQVRVTIDGVPLALSGFGLGLANIPVDLLDRVEVFYGVVPIRLGADALGGALNLVTRDRVEGTGGSAAVQAGDYGTLRTAVGLHHAFGDSGAYVRAFGLLDASDNDYPVDVQVADARGKVSDERAHRFHDAYAARGGGLEVGVVGRPWAERLTLRVFGTDFDKEVQTNLVMSRAYGEVTRGQTSYGALLRYTQSYFDGALSVDSTTGAAWQRYWFEDTSRWVYNWFGQKVVEHSAGEITQTGSDREEWQWSAYERLYAELRPHPDHALQLSVAPTYVTRTGDEKRLRTPDSVDPYAHDRSVLSVIVGAGYQLDLFERVQNVLFAKGYFYRAHTAEAPYTGGYLVLDYDHQAVGFGDMLRVEVLEGLFLKASYELAARLPSTDEVFGDGADVVPNAQIEPERSHNVNFGALYDGPRTAAGMFRAEVSAFGRYADRLIMRWSGNDDYTRYQNLYSARSVGAQGMAGWRSPGRHVELDGNATWMSFRNTATDGPFAPFEGDRIPNRPYLFANGSARLNAREVTSPTDQLSLGWYTRYVHEFFRGWESVGLTSAKQVVPSQLVHSIALTWTSEGEHLELSSTAELENVTDETTYDFFGAQRPGRSFYWKASLEF
jgi:TonB family protein